MANDNPYQPPRSLTDPEPVQRQKGYLLKSFVLSLGMSLALQLFGFLVAVILEAAVPYSAAQKIGIVAMLPLAITQWLAIQAGFNDIGPMLLCIPIAWLWVGLLIWVCLHFTRRWTAL